MLTIMMGVSGSGKTTIAKKIAKELNAVYVSSDEIRKELWGNENEQKNPMRVFWVAEYRTNLALSTGQKVVVDATNLNRKARKPFTMLGRAYGVPIKCVVVNVPVEVAKERNKERKRVVPDEVIDKQFSRFSPPNLEEVDEVEVVNNF